MPAFEEQGSKLKDQIQLAKDEQGEIQIKIESMEINVKLEKTPVCLSRVICSHCHTRGHRNQQSKPCILQKCTDYKFCGIKENTLNIFPG